MGSHNSDTESDLVAIRQKFIRILERYKVDLILCGHSHDYERSKLMKGHYGSEASFDPNTHNLSQSTGLYDGSTNSCPYTKDSVANNGTVYVLSGSAGQLGGQQGSFPHDAMYYSNASNGGSLILDIEGNRLDAQWLCADGVVRDKFTIYKNVNSVKNYTVLPAETKTLEASWPGAYIWNNAATTKTISISSLSNTTFWVKDPNSCVADTFKLKVLPAVDFTMTTPYCAASAITFSDLSTNSTTAWNWSVTPSAGVVISSSTAKNPGITFATAGAYTVSLLAANVYGSGVLMTRTITVNSVPNVVATLNTPSICVNQSATLTATGASTYSWSSGGSNTLITVSPTANTSYTLTGIDLNGCLNTGVQTLTVNSLPSVTATSSPATPVICAGGTLALTGSGATTYTWTGGITNGTNFTLSSNTSYTVTGTDANGCQNTAVKNITVNALPVLTITAQPSNATVCQGSTLALTASGATTYTWSGVAVNSIAFIPTSGGTYTVTGTNANGCTNTLTRSITVNPLPVVSVSGNSTSCFGTTNTLTASGATSYTWNTNSVAAFITVSPTITTTYSIVGVDVNGCMDSETKVLSVNPLPNVTISGNMVVCAGETTTITPTGAVNYAWSNGSTGVLIISPLSGYNYAVTGTDANGCKNSVLTNFIVNPLPMLTATATTSLICAGQSATLSVTGANSYLWNTNSSTSNIVVSPISTTIYSVTGTNTTNCSSSTSITQYVSECTGLEKLSPELHTIIYPNPNKGVFDVRLNAIGSFSTEIFNAQGEKVYSARLETGTNNVSINVSKGIYFYVILEHNKTVETGKIIIE